jgi:hypothetical protein
MSAEYEANRVKSFMIRHYGVLHEKHAGDAIAAMVETIQVFGPDSSWSIVEPGDDS